MFRGAQVSGAYLTVLFTVSLTDGSDQPLFERFTGRLTGSIQIFGTVSSPYGAVELTFTRVELAPPAICSASPG